MTAQSGTSLEDELTKILQRAGVSKGIHRIIYDESGKDPLLGHNKLSTVDTLTEATQAILKEVNKAVVAGRIDEMIRLDSIKFNCEPEWPVHGYAIDRIKELEGSVGDTSPAHPKGQSGSK